MSHHIFVLFNQNVTSQEGFVVRIEESVTCLKSGDCGCESGIFVIIMYKKNFGGCIIDAK